LFSLKRTYRIVYNLLYYNTTVVFIPLILIIFNIVAWYPVLSFWFLGGWEQAWLIGICGYHFDFVCLMQSHGILMLLNYKLFGWNPAGWYLVAILLHISSVLLIYIFTKKLTKNTLFAFIVSLLFGINVAHNDVINWGSFESLYALLMVSFLLSLFSYFRFVSVKTTKRFLWYGLSLGLFLFGLFIREVALVLPFFIIITELYHNGFVINRKRLLQLMKRTIPFGLVSIGYLFFRNWYGGAPHDFIDGMVQLRIALLGQGKYIEYIWRGILSFGRYASSHTVPYPLVNTAREIASRYIYAPVVQYYFFPFLGIAHTVFQIVLIWIFRKDKKLRNILIFAFLWFLIPTIFFSFAFSITDSELERPLVWNYTRWRYFAFFGTVLFWVGLFWKFYDIGVKKYKKKRTLLKRVAVSTVIFVLGINFYFLRVIQKDIYETSFKPAKEFYTALTSIYKTMPNDYVFYYYPFAPGLNDRLAEFYYLRREYYPNLIAERRDWTEGHMGMILERLSLKKINKNSLMFFDLNKNGGLVDKTAEVKKILSAQKESLYPVNKLLPAQQLAALDATGIHQMSIKLSPKLHVEVPYTIHITATARPVVPAEQALQLPADQIHALERYAASRVSLLEQTKVSVCNTAPLGARGAPAMYLLQKNIIDGNIGKRSFWMADCRPAWVQLDLGSKKRIGAIAFRGEQNGPNIPAEYFVETSVDGKTWSKVLTVNENIQYQRIDRFPEEHEARFVRFTAKRTTLGGMLMLDELEVFDEESMDVLDYYSSDFERLIDDSRTYGASSLRFSWATDPNNFAPAETLSNNSFFIPVQTDNSEHTYTIQPNESEYYSSPGQFLKRFITEIHLDATGTASEIDISSIRIVPTYTL